MAFAVIDIAKQFSDDAFVAKMKPGVISTLTGRLPDIQIGETSFFDLSARTKGEVVGEAADKAATPTEHPLRYIRTTKLQYTERFSKEFLEFDAGRQMQVVTRLANKWMGSDFLRDLDTIVIHGVNPHTGEVATSLQDYITKTGSSILVPSTGTSASAIDADLQSAIDSVEDVSGVGFSNSAAHKLASITDSGVQKYPSLGKFGLNVTSFEEVPAAQSKEVGEYGGVQLLVGDFNAIRWGIASEMPVELIKYGDPDGLGDLQRKNQVALRYEVIFGFGIANPKALAVVMTAPEPDDPEQ